MTALLFFITTDNAEAQSGKLTNNFDKDQVQKELDLQREVTESFGQTVTQTSAMIADKLSEESRKKKYEAAVELENAKKAREENDSDTNRAWEKQAKANFDTANREAKEWETGGSQRRILDSALNVVSTFLAGRQAAEVVASGLSPAINHQIKEMTTDKEGNVNTSVNLMAHAIWGGIEAYAGNRNAAAGAAGAVAGETAAGIISQILYDKSPDKLTQDEKLTVSTLSQAAASIAGGTLANNADGAIIAAKTAKDAVENNYLSKEDWNNYSQEIRACDGNKECVSDVNQKYAELDKRQHDAVESACKLGGNLSECQSRVQDAQEGALYASQEIYHQNFSHRDEYWFRNRLEQGYSDGQKIPTDGLVGETVLGRLETLAQNPSFDSSVKSNGDLQKEVYSAINESMLMIRNEDPRAFQIGDMRYPTLQRLGMLGYFPEPGLEGVYPELLLIPTPIKGIGSGVTKGAVRVLSTADKYTQGAVKFTTKHPVTAEMLATGVYKTGEISYNAYNGQYKKDGELENAIYDAIKDVIKVPVLSKLKPGPQALYNVAFDFMYEANKPGATEKQIKTEMVGSGVGAGYGLVSEYTLGKYPSFNGVNKILFNVVGGSITSNEAKQRYSDIKDKEVK